MNENEIQDIGEQVVKHKRPKKSAQMAVNAEPGDNAKYLKHNLQISQLPQIDTSDAKQVENRITEYFTICFDNDMKPSVAGLALAVGVSRLTLWEWATGKNRKATHRNPIKKAYQMLDAQMNDYMQNGKINPVSGIFLMRNNFGYKNETEVVIVPNSPLGEETTQKELENKYMDSIVEVDGQIVDE
ncbi:MAG: DNA-packaging protein [Faecalibacterium sp.]|nr:DNA-packaging protein [Ruminococcus sp.]MCM1391882.1 DNA-packaging protein [Ruminococcus sp.]MCM1485542.1 DNA-packaging protein [Faecalibacterium sp.]